MQKYLVILQPNPDIVHIYRLFLKEGKLETGVSRAKIDRDAVIKVFIDLGFTVRFYEPTEKQWMENSPQMGCQNVTGNRDGSWGIPSLEEFKRSYLRQ